MEKHPFGLFLELVDFDKGVYNLNQTIVQRAQEVEKIKQEKELYIERLEQAKQRLRTARKEVDAKELEMKTLSEQEGEKKKRLDAVSDEKEYQAVKAEIASLKREQHSYEQTLIDAWSQLETAQREHDALNQSLESTLTELETKLQEKTNELTALEADKAERTKQRDQKLVGVPEEWLEKYAVMSDRVPDPVVSVLSDGCSACFYAIPNKDLVALKHGKLLQCKGCYRFLYYEQAAQEQQKVEEA